MELLVLRHAIAFPHDAKRWPDDTLRPLTAKGMKRGRQAAAGIRRIARRPDRVLTSPLIRALDTAKLFAQAARWPEAVECAALAPGRHPEEVLAALRREGAEAECVAVVGHQPHLGTLLALCLRGEAQPQALELRKSAIACVWFDGPPRAGRGVLTALFPPRALRKL